MIFSKVHNQLTLQSQYIKW